jgi:hypothetical protein
MNEKIEEARSIVKKLLLAENFLDIHDEISLHLVRCKKRFGEDVCYQFKLFHLLAGGSLHSLLETTDKEDFLEEEFSILSLLRRISEKYLRREE